MKDFALPPLQPNHRTVPLRRPLLMGSARVVKEDVSPGLGLQPPRAVESAFADIECRKISRACRCTVFADKRIDTLSGHQKVSVMRCFLSTSGPEISVHSTAENFRRFHAGKQRPRVVDFGKGC